jgi:uncharacterized sulfatase
MTHAYSRRQFLRDTALGVSTAAVAGRTAAAQTEHPPNIVFILTDDQGPWALGHSGNAQAHTPNLDRLFAEGAYLRYAMVTTPVCSPSRAGLLTSRYGTELGITDWIKPARGEEQNESHLGLDPAYVTWVELLQQAGYDTALIGKWHLGTMDKYHPTEFGYDHFTGFREGGAPVENLSLEVNGTERTFQGLTVDILTDAAIGYLYHAKHRKPFCLSLHYRSPHAPWKPVAPEDAAPYEEKELEIPNPDYPDLDTDRVEQVMAEYLASVTGVDRNVGRLLDTLDELGLRENTIVIFTSDHGYNVGHHGVLHKGNAHWITNAAKNLTGPERVRPNLWDTSLRVPTAVRWPGVIEPGSTMDRVVTNLDWFPTLLAMAGVDLPPALKIHGRDFLPLLRGESLEWSDEMYAEYSIHHYAEADLRAWRTDEWKLVRDFRNAGKDELYHLAADPEETTNLIEDPQYAGIFALLDEKLLAKRKSIQDSTLD